MTSNDKPQRPRGKPASSGKTGSGKPGKSGFGKADGGRADGGKTGGGKPGFGKPAFAKTGGTKARFDKASGKPAFAQKDGVSAGEGKPRAARPASSGDARAERPAFDTSHQDRPRTDKPRFDRPRSNAAGQDESRTADVRPARTRADAPAMAPDAPQRISKILARAGVASRRDIERMIMEGRVSVNGTKLDTPVVNVTLADRIEVDGHPIRGIERTRLWLYHKPSGLVTTNSDPEGRPTVFDRLPEDLPRVLSIGRLDINTEGLLLLTNDGGLARVLELPATGWLRRYRVRAHGTIEQADLDKLKDGIAVDGVLYGAIEATLDKVQGSNVWITMGLREGKNREIKNVMGALGLDVNRLIRISYGPFQLGELPEGAAQEIRGRTLRDQLGPRLIDDAKANFDAPLFNNPDAEDERPVMTAARTETRSDERTQSGGREKPAFREKPAERNERLRARLDTRPADGDRKRGGNDHGNARTDERPKRDMLGRPRKANVWMAPGARPIAEKKAGAEAEVKDKPLRRERPEGAPKTKRYGRTKDGQATTAKHRFDPDRKASGFARPDPGPRVTVPRDETDRDWIRASDPPAREERGGFKSRDGGDRGFGDKPRGDKSFGERKPRAEGERPFGDKPRGKSFGGKPGGAKTFGTKPGGAKSFSGKPSGGRPAGGKPRGKGH